MSQIAELEKFTQIFDWSGP